MMPDPLMSLLCVSGASAAASYAASTRLPSRLATPLLLLLATYLFIASPTLVDGVLAIQGFTCILGSSAFKIAALSFGRGVLARELATGCSLWRYMGVCMLPVIPTNTGAPAAPGSNTVVVMAKLQKSMMKLVGFTIAMMAGMWALYGPPRLDGDDSPSKTSMTPQDSVSNLAQGYGDSTMWLWFIEYIFKPFLFYCSGLSMWLEVEGMGDLTDALALAMFGITAEPHFRTPVAATTVSEYWGKRWNITMSSMLRELVYLPILEGRMHADPSRLLTHSPSGSSEHHNHEEQQHHNHKQDQAEKHGDGQANKRSEHPKGMHHKHCDSAKVERAKAMQQGVSPTSSGEISSSGSDSVPSHDRAAAHRSDSLGSLRGSVSGIDNNDGTTSSASSHSHAGRRRSTTRKMVATAATFLASGLWHELVFYQLSGGHFSHGYWTAFFLVQVPVIMLETMLLKYASKAGFKEPRWLAMLRVNVTIAILVSVFWAPPLTRPLSRPDLLPQQWHSVFQDIMNQCHHDLQKMVRQQVLAASSLQQVIVSMEATPVWVKQVAGKLSKAAA